MEFVASALDLAGQKNILIIGAGRGALALARALRRQGIPFELFRRDEAAASRTQGWALRLHWRVLCSNEIAIEIRTKGLICVCT